MKKILFICLAFCAVFFFQSCEEDNELTFIAAPGGEGIAFSNSFANEYLLSKETAGNVAERFVWKAADFGAPTNITYALQASLSQAFSTFDVVGSTNETNVAISVEQLLDYAEDLGLDDDPSTTDANGNPNNTGTVYFRLRAYVGAGTGNNTEMISSPQALNIKWIEKVDLGVCDPIFVVGAAAVDAGWGWGTPIVFNCSSDVFQAKVRLTNETFRFFTTEGDWGSGLNYPYYAGEGYTIDPLLENANDGDSNFRFIGTPGIYLVVVDGKNKTITLTPSGSLWLVGAATPGGWSWGAPTEAVESSPDVWVATLAFSNETFRFFTVKDDWGSGLNYPYYEDEGYTIDNRFTNANDGDSNFRFTGTPGTYKVTVNAKDKTITLE
ncbi:MAG: SusF/SusE family outer membrane protein [Saprospiraceae bacterium]|nr:SusF/SusE family outer membrane protein [Saprospiraceae bacterium]